MKNFGLAALKVLPITIAIIMFTILAIDLMPAPVGAQTAHTASITASNKFGTPCASTTSGDAGHQISTKDANGICDLKITINNADATDTDFHIRFTKQGTPAASVANVFDEVDFYHGASNTRYEGESTAGHLFTLPAGESEIEVWLQMRGQSKAWPDNTREMEASWRIRVYQGSGIVASHRVRVYKPAPTGAQPTPVPTPDPNKTPAEIAEEAHRIYCLGDGKDIKGLPRWSDEYRTTCEEYHATHPPTLKPPTHNLTYPACPAFSEAKPTLSIPTRNQGETDTAYAQRVEAAVDAYITAMDAWTSRNNAHYNACGDKEDAFYKQFWAWLASGLPFQVTYPDGTIVKYNGA